MRPSITFLFLLALVSCVTKKETSCTYNGEPIPCGSRVSTLEGPSGKSEETKTIMVSLGGPIQYNTYELAFQEENEAFEEVLIDRNYQRCELKMETNIQVTYRITNGRLLMMQGRSDGSVSLTEYERLEGSGRTIQGTWQSNYRSAGRVEITKMTIGPSSVEFFKECRIQISGS